MGPAPLAAGVIDAAVILAAGLGTRMRSSRAKVLHPLGGRPLVAWACEAVRPLAARTVVVIGHERDAVREALAGRDVEFAVQERQEGTGHALSCALPQLGAARTLLVLPGDAPRLSTATLQRLLDEHAASRAAVTVLTFRAADPAGYGRVLRGSDGRVTAIVEERDADASERRVDEVNSATYAFDAQRVLPLLRDLPRRPNGELYLTDVVAPLARSGAAAACLAPEDEAMGINSQEQLAEAEALYSAGRVAQLRASGVTVVDAASLRVDADAAVGAGSILHPLVAIEGATRLAERCEVGSLVRLCDVEAGAGCTFTGPLAMVSARVPAGSSVGPPA